MYERFTDRARKVMQLANQEAQRFGHEYIGTEHILLGLIAEGSGVAANVLKNLDIDLRKVRREVEAIVQHGPGGEQVAMSRLPYTPWAKKVIECAIEASRGLGHNYVGTEHLLLGLVRAEEGVAAQVLINLGLSAAAIREEVLNLLGPGRELAARPAAPPAAVPESGPHPSLLTYAQLGAFHTLIRELIEQKDAFVDQQKFEEAARCREGLELLKRAFAVLQGRTES